MVAHGELGMLSRAVHDGGAPVKAIRYALHPEDGWWILAARDLPVPDVDDIITCCVHCALGLLDPEVGVGLELARREAETDPSGVGVSVWHQGRWVSGRDADRLGVTPPGLEP